MQAQKCDYTINEKGQKKIMVTLSNQMQIWLNNESGAFSLGFELTYPDIKKEKILKGDTLVLVVGESEYVNLVAREEAPPVGKADETVEITNYFPIYDLPAPVAEKLSRMPITAIKMYFGKDFNLIELEPKKAKKIIEAAGCVRQ